MLEMPECARTIPPCDLWCEAQIAALNFLPLAAGLVIFIAGRMAGPLVLAEQNRAARASLTLGTGWFALAFAAKILPAYASTLWLIGFTAAIWIVVDFCDLLRHRLSPLRSLVFGLLFVSVVLPSVSYRLIHTIDGFRRAALAGGIAVLSAAVALGILSLLSSNGTQSSVRTRLEAGLGVLGALAFFAIMH